MRRPVLVPRWLPLSAQYRLFADTEGDIGGFETPTEQVPLAQIWDLGEQKIPPGFKVLLQDVVDDVVDLRACLKEAMRRLGPRITNPNEYHRQLASVAGKLKMDVERVRAITDAIMNELATEMLAKPTKK